MFSFTKIAQLILGATVKGYEREEFMNLICDRAYRESNSDKVLDLSNFNKWVNGTGQRGGFKIVNEYYRDPGSIERLAEDIETLLIDSIGDLPKLMESLENALNEDVKGGFLSFKRKKELLTGTESEQLAKMLQYAITQRKDMQPTESPEFGMYFLNTELPRSGRPFVGRKRELQRIEKRLQKDSVLFLTGIKGAGKSALALEYARRMRGKYKNCVYIRYKRSFRETIMLLDIAEENADAEIGSAFQSRYQLLKKLKADSLLLLDGMEVLPEDDDSFDQLMGLNCHVLVTTPLQVDENSMFVGMMREERELLDLFYAYCPGEAVEDEDEDVLELVELVHRHTYAVIMMALTVKSGCITVRELIEYILSNGLGFPNEIKIRTVKDGKRLRQPFFDLLQGLFELQELTQEQKALLMNLACMPPEGIGKRDFLSWSGTSAGVLGDLICLGWLQEENYGKTVVMQGIIREMVIETMHPTVKTCGKLLRSVIDLCGRYEDIEEASYQDHDKVRTISDCLEPIMTAVKEHTAECALYHTQLSIYSYKLVIYDRLALLRKFGKQMGRADQMIILWNLMTAISEGYEQAKKYSTALEFCMRESSYQEGVICATLYRQTEQMLKEYIQQYEAFLASVMNMGMLLTARERENLSLLVKSVSETELMAMFAVGTSRPTTVSRVSFNTDEGEQKNTSLARIQMLRPEREGKHAKGKLQPDRKRK